MREERGERDMCSHGEEDVEEEEEHFSLSALFTLKSGVERREKAPESEDKDEDEEEQQAIVLFSSSSTFTSS